MLIPHDSTHIPGRRLPLPILALGVALRMGLLPLGFAESAPQTRSPVFPDKEWRQAAPETMGLDPQVVAAIGRLMDKAHANGVLIRNGYLVAEWTFAGPASKRIEAQSITKTMTGAVLGIALQEGKIPSLNARVKDYYPAFNVGPHTAEITFWHLITATSGIATARNRENYRDPGNMAPGVEMRYHNDHTAQLAAALTYIYGQPLIDILRTRVLARIGASAAWRGEPGAGVRLADGREIPVMAGYAFSSWTARDLARVGWLYLNNGDWNGRQILARSYVKECRTPIKVPIRDFHRKPSPGYDISRMRYGLAWWARSSDAGRLLWYMSGNGGQFCAVLPEYGIVLTKLNGYGKNNLPYVGLDQFEEFIWQLPKAN